MAVFGSVTITASTVENVTADKLKSRFLDQNHLYLVQNKLSPSLLSENCVLQ